MHDSDKDLKIVYTFVLTLKSVLLTYSNIRAGVRDWQKRKKKKKKISSHYLIDEQTYQSTGNYQYVPLFQSSSTQMQNTRNHASTDCWHCAVL